MSPTSDTETSLQNCDFVIRDCMAIETGRYITPYKKPNKRICPLCRKEAEDEKHFLVSFPVYQEEKEISV